MSRNTRSRKYVFTINNYTDDDIARLANMGTRYLCYGKEVGEQGTPHIQGFLYYKNAKSFKSLKKNLPRARIQVAEGSVESNVEYCSKEMEFTEIGTKPRKYNRTKMNRRSSNRWCREEVHSGRTNGTQSIVNDGEFNDLSHLRATLNFSSPCDKESSDDT